MERERGGPLGGAFVRYIPQKPILHAPGRPFSNILWIIHTWEPKISSALSFDVTEYPMIITLCIDLTHGRTWKNAW